MKDTFNMWMRIKESVSHDKKGKVTKLMGRTKKNVAKPVRQRESENSS